METTNLLQKEYEPDIDTYSYNAIDSKNLKNTATAMLYLYHVT